MTPVMLGAAGALASAFVLLWLISVAVKDASIVDIFWGPSFVVVASSGLVFGPAPRDDRAWLVFALVAAWGLRLGLHLARRNLGKGEDYRYRAMRASQGRWFPLLSLVTVYLLQATVAFVVSLPIQFISAHTGTPLGPVDIAGAAISLGGLALEAIADAQLAAFKRDPANKGQVMDRGLWAWSRHPNYFGDAVVWWGLGIVALATGAWLALIGPAVMTLFLRRVSGVTLLEKTIGKRRPGYDAYVERTSAFIPWPPKRKR